jgi:hypothetical protein
VSPVKYELSFYIPEDGILNSHRRENLKSYIFLKLFILLLSKLWKRKSSEIGDKGERNFSGAFGLYVGLEVEACTGLGVFVAKRSCRTKQNKMVEGDAVQVIRRRLKNCLGEILERQTS